MPTTIVIIIIVGGSDKFNIYFFHYKIEAFLKHFEKGQKKI